MKKLILVPLLFIASLVSAQEYYFSVKPLYGPANYFEGFLYSYSTGFGVTAFLSKRLELQVGGDYSYKRTRNPGTFDDPPHFNYEIKNIDATYIKTNVAFLLNYYWRKDKISFYSTLGVMEFGKLRFKENKRITYGGTVNYSFGSEYSFVENPNFLILGNGISYQVKHFKFSYEPQLKFGLRQGLNVYETGRLGIINYFSVSYAFVKIR